MITPLMGRLSNSGSGLITGTTGNQWMPGWGGTDLAPSIAGLGGTAGQRRTIIPCDGVLSNLYVNIDTAGGGSRVWTFTVTKNNVDTALSCTVTDPATTGSNTGSTVSVVAGDLIEIRVVASNGGITATNLTWGMQFSGANASECVTGSASHLQGPATGATNYIGLWNATSGQAVADFQWAASRDTTHENISPLGGTITALHIKLITAPSSGKSWAFSIYKNGTIQASSTVTIANTATTGSVTGLSIAVAAGDTLSLEAVPTGTPTGTGGLCWGVAFTSTTDGESPLCGSVRNAGFNAAANEAFTPMGNHAFSNTEARYTDVAPVAFTLRALRWEVTAAPGSGKTYDVISRNAGANGNLTLSIADAATTGSDLSNNDSIALAALFSYRMTTTGTPSGTTMRWAAVAFVSPSVGSTYTTFGVLTREADDEDMAPTVTYYFEATLKATGGYLASARLYNITDNSAVTGADVSTASLTPVRVRSASFTLPTGSKEYRAEFGGAPSSGTYTCYAADIIADVSG